MYCLTIEMKIKILEENDDEKYMLKLGGICISLSGNFNETR